MDERQHILHGLRGLDEVEPSVMTALARLFDLRTYDNISLCTQGEEASRLWILGHGNISVTRRMASRRSCEVARLSPISMVGFSGLMGIAHRTATLKAEGTIEVLEITTSAAMELLETDGSRAASALRRALIAAVGRQVSTANTNIAKLAVEVGVAEPVISEERLLAAHTLH